MIHKCRGGRFAVRAGNSDHAVRRKMGASEGEQFDIANNRHARFPCLAGNGMAIQRHSGGDDHAVEAGDVDVHRIRDPRPARQLGPRILLPVPRSHFGAAGKQAFRRGQSRTRKSQNREALS